jgi:transcriptional regulator with XRE-family HTH domain
MTLDRQGMDGSPSRSLADKLGYLFDTVRRDDGSEWTGKDVVSAVRARGVDLSPSHLSELRRGLKLNPTVRVLQALADFFEVRVAFFFDDPEAVSQTESDLELRSAMRDAQVQQVAARAAGLSSAQRVAFQRVLADMIRGEVAELGAPGQESEPPDRR